jgi:MFS transporter, DHA2 family, multidrug resistance protein
MPDSHPEWRPRHNPWLIAVAVMCATFMEVLDTSVANVSLPHIAGNLSATTEEATWVLTSYLVSNAIILPMTGWLGNYFGRKRLLISCVMIFTAASALCGLAVNLPTLILARILQGIGGGAMVPIAQAVLLESFPPAKRGVAMATFAIGVIVAPILGPTLGGWITDNYSWRWIFYINLPVGVLAVLMQQWVIEDPPYIKRDTQATVDFVGFGLLAAWLATLQIVLDKGQEADWFAAVWVCWFTLISVLSFLGFIAWEFITDHPVVDLRIFKNRNYATGVMLMTVLGAVLYGTVAAQPIFMQTLLGYTALESGYAISPRGIGAFITTLIVGRLLVGKVRNRYLLITGFILLASSSLWQSQINLSVAMRNVAWPSVLNGVAISFIFVPLTTVSLGHLAQRQIPNATGMYNLMRNLGGSVGIAFVTTMISRDSQTHQAMMTAHLTPYDRAYVQHVAAAQAAFAAHTDPVTAAAQAHYAVYAQLLDQARLWAFVDNFRIFSLLSLSCIPLVFLFKCVKPGQGPPAGGGH